MRRVIWILIFFSRYILQPSLSIGFCTTKIFATSNKWYIKILIIHLFKFYRMYQRTCLDLLIDRLKFTFLVLYWSESLKPSDPPIQVRIIYWSFSRLRINKWLLNQKLVSRNLVVVNCGLLAYRYKENILANW